LAERTILVCDVCGKPATETISIKTNGGNFNKDLCATYVAELTNGARRPQRGRRPGTKSAATSTCKAQTTARRRRASARKAAA
jgi:hypothetical protein